jgi:hypothetical protein
MKVLRLERWTNRRTCNNANVSSSKNFVLFVNLQNLLPADLLKVPRTQFVYIVEMESAPRPRAIVAHKRLWAFAVACAVMGFSSNKAMQECPPMSTMLRARGSGIDDPKGKTRLVDGLHLQAMSIPAVHHGLAKEPLCRPTTSLR